MLSFIFFRLFSRLAVYFFSMFYRPGWWKWICSRCCTGGWPCSCRALCNNVCSICYIVAFMCSWSLSLVLFQFLSSIISNNNFFSYSSLPLLLPAVEDGIFNDSWRIRQSSVELLGDLLFKVCVSHPRATLSQSLIWPFGELIHFRLLELLVKLYLRVAVMMKVLVQRHMVVPSLKF